LRGAVTLSCPDRPYRGPADCQQFSASGAGGPHPGTRQL